MYFNCRIPSKFPNLYQVETRGPSRPTTQKKKKKKSVFGTITVYFWLFSLISFLIYRKLKRYFDTKVQEVGKGIGRRVEIHLSNKVSALIKPGSSAY